ncbi:DUF2577 domain-containing protein [Bacillus sp. Gen3]|uniref:DUF2577 domain-containing protein n=1 Tax=Heyndrickxia oleronia TaxID=38875 RepID=UPI0015D19FDB|nr:DUF2577 domain-containing protein [Bacillus sp. Gen3]
MYDNVKKAAVKAVMATNPVNILYGTVENAKPLEIRVHEKLKLTEEFLDIAEHLTRHERIVSVDYQNPKTWPDSVIGDAAKDTSSSEGYSKYNLKYAKMIFENGLKKGDKVVLLRVQGGHRFLVIDRYKRGEEVWSYQ